MSDHEEFSKALRRLPLPVSCFSNGACCPWCGALNKTVTFGMNGCVECGKEYAFGYPDWHSEKDPVSWVPFPWREFEACGGRADLIPEFKPNERLQQIYFQKTEEHLGRHADMTTPN
jgi:hypothetical protein